jgi:hypothetical protein
MVIGSRNRRVNQIPGCCEKPNETGASAISWRAAPVTRSSSIHRDT